jgi:hypothetical protein
MKSVGPKPKKGSLRKVVGTLSHLVMLPNQDCHLNALGRARTTQRGQLLIQELTDSLKLQSKALAQCAKARKPPFRIKKGGGMQKQPRFCCRHDLRRTQVLLWMLLYLLRVLLIFAQYSVLMLG